MSPQNFKAFTFDVVGTLIDFEGGMPACLHPFLAHTVPDYHLHALAGSADAAEAGR